MTKRVERNTTWADAYRKVTGSTGLTLAAVGVGLAAAAGVLAGLDAVGVDWADVVFNFR